MTFKHIITVANPSPYERSDYVEVDLETAGVPPNFDENTLRLLRRWPAGLTEEAFQIDYPFGRNAGYRILTLFCRNSPPGDADYGRHTAEFLLEEGAHTNFADRVQPHLLKIEHFPAAGIHTDSWDPGKRYVGVKLFSGGVPLEPSQVSSEVSKFISA